MCNLWRIASAESGLPKGMFIQHKLPMPETVAFQDWTQLVPSAEGSTNKAGYGRCTLTWANITRPQLFKLRRIVDGLSRNTRLWMTVDRNNGTKGSQEWINVSGYPVLSDPQAEAVGRASAQSYNITLTLNNVTVIGDAY